MKGDYMEYYFDGDDRLGRKRYAEFLKTMLEHCDDYRREDSDGAYVIAIDSPWGTGKTRFGKMLRNYLEGREPRIIEDRVDRSFIPQPSEHREFNVIYYNSWDTDYWNDALEPLIYSIMNSQVLEVEGAEEDIEKLKIAIGSILKGMAMALVKLAFGDAASSLVGGAINGFDSIPDDPLAEYKQRLDQYTDFKETLNSAIERTGKKLVIIVDELDRCRPTFAIQTLELAKHLFDVEGLIFIFALDIEQLSHAVKTVYGAEMDASGYLCRFFDYIGRLPMPDQTNFIQEELIQTGYFENDRYKVATEQLDSDMSDLLTFVNEYCVNAKLSLRDITTLFKTYKMMVSTFLSAYDLEALKFYFILLLLKYKYVGIYSTITSERKITQEFGQYFRNGLGFDLPSEIREKLNILNQKERIKSNNWVAYDAYGEKLGGGVPIQSIKQIDERRGVQIQWIFKRQGFPYSQAANYGKNTNLENIIFFEDMLKWEEIKDLTLAQYYHRQLEMFDFVLPAEQEHGEN